MATEIERKYLVRDDSWREPGEPGVAIRQGYLSLEEGCTVRVRVTADEAFLTIKGAISGVSRREYEVAIPVPDAEELLALCAGRVVVKTRHRRWHGGFCWEIDEFAGENAGLIVAEIELPAEGQAFSLPAWAGEEVSHAPRYANASLALTPFRVW